MPKTPLAIALQYSWEFTPKFLAYLPGNIHVYQAFEEQALKVAAAGHRHYSARTIVEVLRHHSALADSSAVWKINDHATPYLARLFALMHPGLAYLFEFREVKAARPRLSPMDGQWIGASI